MARIEEIIAQKVEARLEAKLDVILDGILDGILEKAVEGALARILGVEPTESAPKAKRTRKAKAPKAEATEAKAPEAAPTPTAAPTTEDQLLARLERVASGLGEKYGPMLMRRARAIAKHALNPTGALAALAVWAEKAPAEVVVDILRGSERLPDGTTLSGWRLMAARLGIPVQE